MAFFLGKLLDKAAFIHENHGSKYIYPNGYLQITHYLQYMQAITRLHLHKEIYKINTKNTELAVPVVDMSGNLTCKK